MAKPGLIGSRIRERRLMSGLRQAQLAQAAGISPSYLNLIEHNRRRIGGKLLVDIAAILQVEPSLLSEGGEATLIAALKQAANVAQAPVEMERAEEFAARLPGWAQFLALQRRRVETLEHVVETLTDRLAHDPHLAASLHEVLSSATAIRATAAILVETKELEPEWRDRFHRNMNEDSQRLALSSQALVSYLDKSQNTKTMLRLPQDEVDAFLEKHRFHFPMLEAGAGQPQEIVAQSKLLQSGGAQAMAVQWLERYQGDAARMPTGEAGVFVRKHGLDPAAVAQHFQTDIASAMRRLATLPDEAGAGPVGLVACDGAGALVFRKAIAGFDLPRTGAGCALWPLYQALSRPMTALFGAISQAGQNARFDSYAIAQPSGTIRFDSVQLYESYMLILPVRDAASPALEVGPHCRMCPKVACAARREPSVLVDGF